MQDLQAVVDWLDHLVAVDTSQGHGNAQIIDLILQRFALQDIRAIRIPSPLGDAEGLVLSAGPDTPGGLILSGHLDVVPVTGQTWTSNPFQLRTEGDTLFGRGTCDMKGFVACALAELDAHAKTRRDTPLHVVLSADEESTCRSIETLVNAVQTHLPPMRGVMVGEPTMMVPANRHKASATHEVTVAGRAVHASMAHLGIDAVALAAQLITWLSAETEKSAASQSGHGVDPNHDLHSASQIKGGTSLNTVADRCSFVWDMRLMPEQSMAAITSAFDAYAKELGETGAHIARTCTAFFPGLDADPQSPFAESLLDACGAEEFVSVPYGTEAGHFHTAGFDTFVCGPGDPATAHLANEHVTLSQLNTCVQSIRHLIVA